VIYFGWRLSPLYNAALCFIAAEEEKKLFAKKAGCQKGLQPIDAGYHTHNETKIDQIYTNITC